jgi:hypothetical protein
MYAEYDFVGASASGKQPTLVPKGRNGYETDGAMFASRVNGESGGLARTIGEPIVTVTIVTVRDLNCNLDKCMCHTHAPVSPPCVVSQ